MNEMYNGSNERAKTNDKSIGNVAGKHTYDL